MSLENYKERINTISLARLLKPMLNYWDNAELQNNALVYIFQVQPLYCPKVLG